MIFHKLTSVVSFQNRKEILSFSGWNPLQRNKCHSWNMYASAYVKVSWKLSRLLHNGFSFNFCGLEHENGASMHPSPILKNLQGGPELIANTIKIVISGLPQLCRKRWRISKLLSVWLQCLHWNHLISLTNLLSFYQNS